MATTNEITVTNPALFTIPAHLWIGPHQTVHTHIICLLQARLCPQKGCLKCAVCNAIATEQYYAIQWIRPEKQYTRELLEPLFEQLAFTLNVHEQFFFILEHVDFMSSACANSLLKSLEEPPQGYYFFLCAEREHTILPTIRSRCVIHNVTTKNEAIYKHSLFDYFVSTTFYDPSIFLEDLEKSEINERESIELLDALLAYWMHTAKKALQENNIPHHEHALHIIRLLAAAFEKPPMPGSSKIFWKDMYLHIKTSTL